MQTFLPYPDFSRSVACLDYRRLGKQRVECLQILRALEDSTYGWQNHPAVRMWRGFSGSLAEYAQTVCREWISRGYKDTCLEKLTRYASKTIINPEWLGDRAFHSSHRAALLAKDPLYYERFGWKEKPKIDYRWPTSTRDLKRN
jgi:hypothetical protein